MKFYYPIKGKFEVTCPFGKKGNWHCGWHTGVDFVAHDDYTIYSIADGVVIGINCKGKAYGNHVVIKHSNNIISLYAHLKSISVNLNQKVKANQKIGVMGKTGNASGIHLHFELHRNEYKYPPTGSKPKDCIWLLNPINYLEENKKQMETKQLKVIINNKPVLVECVNIGGNNFIKLRDIEKLFDVSVTFNGTNPVINKK